MSALVQIKNITMNIAVSNGARFVVDIVSPEETENETALLILNLFQDWAERNCKEKSK